MAKTTHYLIPVEKVINDPGSDYRIIDKKDMQPVNVSGDKIKPIISKETLSWLDSQLDSYKI